MDVARQAGVSKSTVSRVLTGHPRVQKETRERVEQAIQALGYRPNALARGLARGRTYTLGLVLFALQNPFFGLVAQGAEMAARARGYHMLITTNGTLDREQQQACLGMLAERRVDGILIAPLQTEEQDLVEIQKIGVRTVLLDTTDGRGILSSVGGDNVQGGYLATKHLLDLGHRRIGVLSHLSSLSSVRQRLQGYCQAHVEKGVNIDTQLIMRDLSNMHMVREAVHHLLNLPEPPTALFAINDDYAIAALQTLALREYWVPEDIALMGYDDLPIASWLTVPLTTVNQPKEEMGRIATDLLIDQIEHPELPVRHIILPPHLVVRRSCGAKKKAHNESFSLSRMDEEDI